MDSFSDFNKENALGDPQIPPMYQGMRPVLFTPDYQAILYLGSWNSTIDPNEEIPDPSRIPNDLTLFKRSWFSRSRRQKGNSIRRSIGFVSDKTRITKVVDGIGDRLRSQIFTPEIEVINSRVNRVINPRDGQYNAIVMDHYLDGTEYSTIFTQIKPRLIQPSGLFTLSMGYPRMIDISARKLDQVYYYLSSKNIWIKGSTKVTKETVYQFLATDYSIALMYGSRFQEIFFHEIKPNHRPSDLEEGPSVTLNWLSLS